MEEAQQQKEIEKIYAEMYRWAEDEINRFYGKYADAEGIDITEAKKRVTQADIEAYEALAKEYVKNKDFSDRANAEMRLYNATMRINRLEMLKARIGIHLVDGINDIDKYYEQVITDRTRQEIERQAGILGETVTNADTTKRANNIVNATFFNATYSERIWSHQDRLRSMINIELQKGLIAGVGSREMAQRVKREFDVSMSDAHRLMVTELRRVQTDVAMDSYKASGVEKYVYMAVNPRACPICREIDGEVYNVADAEPAKNAPPMHPRCHCTTAPYVEEDEYNAWLNYLNQGGSTSDWNKMSLAERQQYRQPVVQSDTGKRWSKDDVEYSTNGQRVIDKLETFDVEYRQAEEWETQPSDTEIIKRISGGDKTTGSCASLAWTYIANKRGLNVLDFRGGGSQDVFSGSTGNMARLDGVKAIFDYGRNVNTAKGLLKQMGEGKEYALSTGRHASMVRLYKGKQQYLELQSPYENGWKDFGSTAKEATNVLTYRFGCFTGNNFAESRLIDADSFKDSDEFRALVGYINTAESAQKKGSSGYAK